MSLSRPDLPMIAEKDASALAAHSPDGLPASFPYTGCALTTLAALPHGCCTGLSADDVRLP
jgi:hypothetical protein